MIRSISLRRRVISGSEVTNFKKEDYDKSEDSGLYEYAMDVLNGVKKWKPYVLSDKISERFASDIGRIVGFSVEDYGNAIHQSEIEHINNRHGKNGTSDHSMANLHELAKVQYVIENYTNIREGIRSSHFRNADGSYAKTVLLQVKLDDGYYYVVEAVPDSKRKNLMITSAFKNKKDIFSEGVNTNKGPDLYVQDGAQPNISSKDIISNSAENTTDSEEKFSDRDIKGIQYADRNLYLNETDIEEYLNSGKRRNIKRRKAYEDGKKVIISNEKELREFVSDSINLTITGTTVGYGRVGQELADKIYMASNEKVDVHGFFLELTADDLYHSYKEHQTAKRSGNIPMTENDIVDSLLRINSADVEKIEYHKDNRTDVKLFLADTAERMVVLEVVSLSIGSLKYKTGWKETFVPKTRSSANTVGNNRSNTNLSGLVSMRDTAASGNIVPQNAEKETDIFSDREKFSDRDIKGIQYTDRDVNGSVDRDSEVYRNVDEINSEEQLSTYNLDGKWNDYIGIQKEVIGVLKREGYFDNSEYANADTGMVIRINPKGIKETLGTGKRFQSLPKKLKMLKIATITANHRISLSYRG